MQIIRIPVGNNLTNCYLLISTKGNECAVIDPGDQPDKILRTIKQYETTPVAILATHGEYDQVMASYAIQEKYPVPFYIHPDDKEMLKDITSISSLSSGALYPIKPPNEIREINDASLISIGDIKLKIMLTSGHTKGSISYFSKEEEVVFCGDVVEKSHAQLKMPLGLTGTLKYLASIKRILDLPESVTAYPSHENPQIVKDLRVKWSTILKY